MGVTDRDSHTGHATTGHEWNGIKELNTAVPKTVWFFLTATALFAVGYWLLMPAWPLGKTYTKGLLGSDVRRDVAVSLRDAEARRSIWTSRIEKEDFAAIQADAALMRDVRESGGALFGDNCAVCHGTSAKGGPGFPNLVDEASLWGVTPEAVLETIRVGVNSVHKDARTSQMPAFGRDGILDRQAIFNVVAFVRSLSDPAVAKGPESGRIAAGREAFAANCAACHNDNAQGNKEMGAPDLTDRYWLYGGDEDAIYRTVYGGRQGHMPTWEGRLSALDRKILTLYILDLKRRMP